MFHQTPYRIRFEWGAEAVRRLAPLSGAVVIVDVLSFTTCVEVAVSSEALVFPYGHKDESAAAFAESVHAVLAGKRGTTPSLSPSSLRALPLHSRIVLPSQNGSACTLIAQAAQAATIAGCLRNAAAVADYIDRHHPGEIVSVIACGEQWAAGGLRPAIEDMLAAGAILSRFDPSDLSPEAGMAVAAFRSAEHDIGQTVLACSSGRELIEKGFAQDVALAGELNVSGTVPVFQHGAFGPRKRGEA
ncbi:phosphosulfolactate phosphohydrolase [Paenibacillus lycopersici]|uniref:Probable 2-phosphosulfolactate phosphatase n=1 Tax=Paenibacillus lycopersici TaxID=2704462 RepID=A0A6C0FRB3_9BACL|nr:2-phosphosulfolactate phosphatase [Paenibacillus lycopersici]QHT59676.1 phosphosulfolactate phosphohydrolase [Paenibacillus lycopersici]